MGASHLIVVAMTLKHDYLCRREEIMVEWYIDHRDCFQAQVVGAF